jgi:hypothetical protein
LVTVAHQGIWLGGGNAKSLHYFSLDQPIPVPVNISIFDIFGMSIDGPNISTFHLVDLSANDFQLHEFPRINRTLWAVHPRYT